MLLGEGAHVTACLLRSERGSRGGAAAAGTSDVGDWKVSKCLCWDKIFVQVMYCLSLLVRVALWDVVKRLVGFSKDLITLSALRIL